MVFRDQTGRVAAFVSPRLVGAPPIYDPGGLTCLVDDFVVLDESEWSTAGAALLEAVRAWASEHGASQLVAVAGSHDLPKRDLLRSAGLSIASEWWVDELESPVSWRGPQRSEDTRREAGGAALDSDRARFGRG